MVRCRLVLLIVILAMGSLTVDNKELAKRNWELGMRNDIRKECW